MEAFETKLDLFIMFFFKREMTFDANLSHRFGPLLSFKEQVNFSL